MTDWVPVFPSCRSRWTYSLHLFYALLFTFVLPFICWGAAGTSGHPHAMPHWVFRPPMMEATMAMAPAGMIIGMPVGAPLSASEMLSEQPTSMLCTVAGTHGYAGAAGAQSALPIGRSSPPMLAVASLLLLGLVTKRLFPGAPSPGFLILLSGPELKAPVLTVAVPPPR